MRKLFVFTFILLFVSCQDKQDSQKHYQAIENQPDMIVVVIDSCEYLYGPWGNATVLTHKGNCSNKSHKIH